MVLKSKFVNTIKSLFVLFLLACFFVANSQEYRSYSGHGNNKVNLEWGAAGNTLSNVCEIAFGDGVSSPSGKERGNPREISNLLFQQQEIVSDHLGNSDLLWAFGQFIDHDVAFVEDFLPDSHPEEAMFIKIPFNDQHFAPNSLIPMMRSKAVSGSGTSEANYRKYANEISAFVDGSMVYGSTESRAKWLRTFQNGKMKVSKGNLLPWNTLDGEFNSSIDYNAPTMDNHPLKISTRFYVAGDKRANENPLLTSLHTIFVREHNRLCDVLSEENPSWNDETLYQYSRKLVGGIIQRILYYEWLPSLGIKIPKYSTYNSQIKPDIFNSFSAAAFRMGHTLINSNVIRMKNNGIIMSSGNISLKDAFFNPLAINFAGGIEPFLKGMATQVQQEFDTKIVDDLRNLLFGTPEVGGLDLAAININRGRDRGLPDYNTVRANFGLPRVATFGDICKNQEVRSQLVEIYGSVDNIDPWVGMLSEDHLDGVIFGELVQKIIARQFRNLRDGDRFYFENDKYISDKYMNMIESSTMTNVIRRNTSIDLMQSNAFKAMPHDNINKGPYIEHVNLYTTIYPNPVSSNLNFITWSSFEEMAHYQLIDERGLVVMSGELNLNKGKNYFNLPFDFQYPMGVYHLRVYNKLSYSVSRVFIQN